MSDPYDLQRFVDAQDAAAGSKTVFTQACEELRAGHKRTHWMWFIFPQAKGLGQSQMSVRFAISSPEEAKAYLQHPVLGPRLKECARLVTAVEGRSINEIFGYPDTLKFRSCMTLFAQATVDNEIFLDALSKYFPSE